MDELSQNPFLQGPDFVELKKVSPSFGGQPLNVRSRLEL